MSLDKYRSALTAFDKYYDLFLQNSLKRVRYRIMLTNGESAVGIPTAGSMADPRDPNMRFFFRADDGSRYNIPYSELKEVAPIDAIRGEIRTIHPHTLGGGDFAVLAEKEDLERLLNSSGRSTLRVTVASEVGFVDGAPHNYYKYLTIQGFYYRIITIKRLSAIEIELTIDPARGLDYFG